MTTSTSLLSKIPIPQKPNDIIVTTPLASVKVGDIEQDTPKAHTTESTSWWQKLKNKYIEYRMNKIANKSPEQRTANEQAEYEANQKSLNCGV